MFTRFALQHVPQFLIAAFAALDTKGKKIAQHDSVAHVLTVVGV